MRGQYGLPPHTWAAFRSLINPELLCLPWRQSISDRGHPLLSRRAVEDASLLGLILLLPVDPLDMTVPVPMIKPLFMRIQRTLAQVASDTPRLRVSDGTVSVRSFIRRELRDGVLAHLYILIGIS